MESVQEVAVPSGRSFEVAYDIGSKPGRRTFRKAGRLFVSGDALTLVDDPRRKSVQTSSVVTMVIVIGFISVMIASGAGRGMSPLKMGLIGAAVGGGVALIVELIKLPFKQWKKDTSLPTGDVVARCTPQPAGVMMHAVRPDVTFQIDGGRWVTVRLMPGVFGWNKEARKAFREAIGQATGESLRMY